MPRLTVAYPKGQWGTGQGEGGDTDQSSKWMDVVKDYGEGERAERQKLQRSSTSKQTSWSQALRTLRRWKGWYSFAVVGAVWSVCQVEVPLHPSLLLLDVWGCRLTLVCLLWMALGGCVHALRCCLRPGQKRGEPRLRMHQDVVAENSNIQYSGRSQNQSHDVPLAVSLANRLLLCVLQEPLSDPSVPHIKTLLSQLESVSDVLGAHIGSAATLEGFDRDCELTDKVKLIHNYLQQRLRSLCRLIQVQADFKDGVRSLLEGLDGLWAQLEELHTGVTLSKEENQGHRDLASAHTDTETLFAVLGHYKNRLQCCQAHLTDSTLLLQELTWSHAHISNRMSSSSESVWPELLLQSNIEQFDKVQESFLSLEQQTSTFQAHLEGLGKGNQEGHARPLAHANGAHSCRASPRTSVHLHSDVLLERRNSTPASMTAFSEGADTEKGAPLSLCERSALHFSSTIGRLRKSGRRK